MQYKDIITIEPGKRGGKPCIRGMRITVYDVLEYGILGFRHVRAGNPERLSLPDERGYSCQPKFRRSA